MKTLLVPPFRRPALWLCLLLLLLPAWVCAYSANPDLTAAGAIATLKADASASPLYGRTYNLGATGLRGWIYIDPTNIFSDPAIRNPTDVGQDGRQTAQSRQILVTVASAPGNATLFRMTADFRSSESGVTRAAGTTSTLKAGVLPMPSARVR